MVDPVVPGIIFFTVLQIVAAALRVFVRVYMVRRFGWDDAAMLVTLVLACAFDALMIGVYFETKLMGLSQIPADNFEPALRMTLSLFILYIAGSVWLKIALGLLLRRVLVEQWQKRVIYAVMAICIAYGSFYLLFVLFECGSPGQFATRIVVTTCLTPDAISGTSYTHAALNALADLIFLCMPIVLLWKADMDRRFKISVGFILGVGSVGGICTVVRIAYINTLTTPAEAFFENARIIALMSSAELSIGITCICLSTYKPLVHALFPTSNRYYYEESAPSASHRSTARLTTHGEEMSAVSSWRAPSRGPNELDTVGTRASLDEEVGSTFTTSKKSKGTQASTRTSIPSQYTTANHSQHGTAA